MVYGYLVVLHVQLSVVVLRSMSSTTLALAKELTLGTLPIPKTLKYHQGPPVLVLILAPDDMDARRMMK
jgi:hypothetical protein